MKRLGVLVVLLILLVSSTPAFAKSDKNLYYTIQNYKSPIQVYVPAIENGTGKDKADLVQLKSALEETLGKRVTQSFKIVDKPEDADLIFNIKVKEYYWTKDDPIEPITSAPLMVYDAVTNEHYAMMKAQFNVVDAKTQKSLWNHDVRSTISDVKMSEEDSVKRVNLEVVQNFMRDAFSKKKA